MTRQLLNPAPPTERVGRYPKHPFVVNSKPFTLQPISISRVLPGETVQNLHLESRVVTSPVVNSIIGWKKEYYFFYVKITDLLDDAIRDMFVDETNTDLGATKGDAVNDTTWYCAKGGIDWMQKATIRIVDTYFRDEGETMSQYALANGIPIVQIKQDNALESLTDDDRVPEGAAIATATDAGDLDRLMDAYEMLRSMSFTSMTYEDWLRSQGIPIPKKDENKPELICRFSDFQYPTNHIGTDATNQGVPTAAVSWVFKNHMRDPKRFTEPGFIIGYTVTRPKVYLGGLAGSVCGFAARAWDWMPNYLRHMPETSLKRFALDTGPLGARATDADDYWLDLRDELLYGDQWQNVIAAAADPLTSYPNHVFPLPAGTNIKWKYLTEAMINNFFIDTANGRVKEDGYVSFSIKGWEVDYTMPKTADA